MSAVLTQTLPFQSMELAEPPYLQLPSINCVVFYLNGDLVLEAATAQAVQKLSEATSQMGVLNVGDEPRSNRRLFYSNECGQAYGLIRTLLRSLQVSEEEIRQIATLLPDGANQPELQDSRHRVQLTSRDFISAPGVVRWATQGYEYGMSQKEAVGHYIAILADGYDLGPILAEKVLRKEIPWLHEGESIVLLLNDEQLRCFLTRRADLQSRPGNAELVI